MSGEDALLRLRDLRKASDLSQTDLAEKVGVRIATISAYETGKKSPDARMMARIADALGVLPHELFSSFSAIEREVAKKDPDADLETLTPADLLAAARAMRRAIRAHRDASGHDLCWRQPDLWALLPDPPKGGQVVPDWPQFLRGCVRYRQSVDDQLPDAPRVAREFDG